MSLRASTASLQLVLGLVLTSACERAPEPSRSHTPKPASFSQPASVPPITRLAAPSRIVAVGDLHGDLEATRAALRLAGAIDDKDRWAGGVMMLVQTGDQLDRGDGERAILDLLDRLTAEAKAAGGSVVVLDCNHEIMNVALDFRYVTETGFKDFAALAGAGSDDARVASLPEAYRVRASAPHVRSAQIFWPTVHQTGRAQEGAEAGLGGQG